MLEALKFILGWLDKSGGSLLVGFLLGSGTVLLTRHQLRCHYQGWEEHMRKCAIRAAHDEKPANKNVQK